MITEINEKILTWKEEQNLSKISHAAELSSPATCRHREIINTLTHSVMRANSRMNKFGAASHVKVNMIKEREEYSNIKPHIPEVSIGGSTSINFRRTTLPTRPSSSPKSTCIRGPRPLWEILDPPLLTVLVLSILVSKGSREYFKNSFLHTCQFYFMTLKL